MALAMVLRNSAKLKGFSSIPRCTFNVQKTQNFTQFRNPKTTSQSLVSKCKMNFVNVVQQAKRPMSSDHSKLWTIEKVLSLGLLGIVPATFICPNQVLDDLFALSIVMHFHWGLEACVIDYVRPIVVGPVLPKLSLALLYLISAGTLASLLYYNHTQIGIGQTVKKFWSISK
ncbi:succinate dehydrogenase, subunit D [Rhynchophorus ferrugineus]|uniref:succinate dehydrogenase, subunit D n=1 Tax=Rhynchophorus ferrugineus TaxID=354439 RepID=UPI003FCC8E75